MNDEPSKIAEQLVEMHGDDGAWGRVRKGILAAQEDEDNYSLSVWREVRRELTIKRDTAVDVRRLTANPKLATHKPTHDKMA